MTKNTKHKPRLKYIILQSKKEKDENLQDHIQGPRESLMSSSYGTCVFNKNKMWVKIRSPWLFFILFYFL